MSRVYLNDMGIVCALGSGIAQVRAALSAADEPRGVLQTEEFTPGRPLALGVVRTALATLSRLPVQLRGRNNALLANALEQIEPQARAAVARYGASRVAVVLGTSTSGVGETQAAQAQWLAQGHWPTGFHYAQQEMGTAARFVALALGTTGPAHVISSACSSSAKALASAARLLRCGLADAVIAGGADALCAFTIAGFSALESVSHRRCNPLSVNRCGINIGEGASLFLMSREPGGVCLSGWGESSDAHHMSAPDPSGGGASNAVTQALLRAGINAADVDYINLHGTATAQNDAMEARMISEIFGARVPVSSTKPLTGHALGAAGAIEAGLCWLTLVGNPDARLPPHWWDACVDSALPPLNLVRPGASSDKPLRHVLSQSFAFGGSNAALVMSVP